MADNPLDLEVLFRVDFGDDTNYQVFHIAGAPVTVVVGPRKRGYLDVCSFYNELALCARGDLLGIINDDVTFILQGWDTLLKEAATTYSHGIACLLETRGEFPFVTRKWVETLGWITDEREVHCDTFIGQVAERAGCLVRLPAFLQPVCLDDDTFHEAQALVKLHRTSAMFSTPEHAAWRAEAVETLLNAIHSYHPK